MQKQPETIAADVTPGAVIYHDTENTTWFVLSVPKRWGERWILGNLTAVRTADLRTPRWRFL